MMGDYEDYFDNVVSAMASVKGELVPVDKIPYEQIRFYFGKCVHPYLAAESILMDNHYEEAI